MTFDPTIEAKQSRGPLAARVAERTALKEEPPRPATLSEAAAHHPAPATHKEGSPPPAPKVVAGVEIPREPCVLVEVPIDVDVSVRGFATGNIDFNATPRQAAAAKLLWCSLSAQGRRFQGGRSANPDGTTVETASDGIRWLLDRLADAIEADCGVELTKDFGLVFR